MTDIKKKMYKIREGDMILSPGDSTRGSFIMVSDDRVLLSSRNNATGISIQDEGIEIQGKAVFSGQGKSVEKGSYSENPKGAKIYTYKETLYFESKAKENAYKRLGETTGANLASMDVGVTPIITDLAAGPIPHVHTISMNHVHRVEPQYIYKVPSYIKMLGGAMGSFKEFLNM